MKVRLESLFIAKPVFDKIFNTAMSGKLAYRVSKLSKVINAKVREIEVQRNKLIETYADEQTKEEKEKGTRKVGKKMKEFADEFGAFLSKEEDITIDLIPSSLFLEIKISPNDLNAIEQFINFNENGAENAKI